MDSQNSPSLTAPIPPFLSVYDSGSSRSSLEGLSSDVPQPFSSKLQPNDACFSPVDAPTFAHFHQPRNSTSTSASDSTESSPTTTVSLDSSSMTEPSPGPSPQSPASMNFAMDASRFTPLDSAASETLPLPFQERRPSTPAKRGRNLKNLAVNTSAAYNLGRAISTAPLKPEQEKQKSAPSSPLFVKPPTPPRRKMGNISLTIMTPANSTMGNAVPPTPSITRPTALRHFQSSPSLPLFTSGFGPAGGMTLPNTHPTTTPRGFAEIPMEDEEEEEETNFDIPQSQEEKPDSYPNGPIRIYESGIDLYYEPTAEVASRYDVIMNVASEVINPFDVADAEARRFMLPLPPSNNIGILAEGTENTGSPTTPKATPINTEGPTGAFAQSALPKRPEYIHIPWEHNTDIVPDLFRLVKVIDERVKQEKTVLVHCQCGVSRSASLIVAYGLYKNPEMSVQDAYNAVKKRSKWIGPNMSLIMQLQEFKSGLDRELAGSDSFGFPRISSTFPTASTTSSFDSKTPSAPPTPRTAPLVSEEETSPIHLPPTGPFTAAPIESASGSFWEAAFRRSWGTNAASNNLTIPGVSLVTDTPYVDTKGHVVPVVTVLQNDKQPASESTAESSAQPTSQPSAQFSSSLPSQNSFRTPNYRWPSQPRKDTELDIQMTDAPLAEPVLSPRSTEFHMAPLVPPPSVDSFDEFNILSPKTQDFHSPIFSSAPSSPPEPSRAAPPPPVKIEYPMDSLGSIFSPTSGSFPRVQPLCMSSPVENGFLVPQQSQTSQRIDSLVPLQSPPLPTPQLREYRKLRSKYSAPNLSQCLELQKIQTEIASSLPKRPAEAEEALLSPRATNFVANPFHDLPNSIPENSVTDDESREHQIAGLDAPSTPKSTNSDPRSPAQFGLSPITRNIWGMI